MSGLTIVMFATRGLGDFVENALRGMTRCQIKGDAVHVITTSNAEEQLSEIVAKYGAKIRTIESFLGSKVGDCPPHYVEFNTPEFKRITHLRLPVIRELLKNCHWLIHTDVDVAWLRSPLGYLQEVIQCNCWAMQTEAEPCFPPAFCTGFYAVRSSPEVFELIDCVIARSSQTDRNDQDLFNEVVREKKRFSDIFPLPESLFPIGKFYPMLLSTAQYIKPELQGMIQPFVFHANWTIGLENKRSLLKLCNAWEP